MVSVTRYILDPIVKYCHICRKILGSFDTANRTISLLKDVISNIQFANAE